MSKSPSPLPSPWRVHTLPKGYTAQSRAIRALYGQRCTVAEIAAGLAVTEQEVRRTLRHPMQRGRI